MGIGRDWEALGLEFRWWVRFKEDYSSDTESSKEQDYIAATGRPRLH